MGNKMNKDLDQKDHVPDRKTIDEVFDKSTLDAIYELMSRDHFDHVDYPISTGKEAKVFKAITREGSPRVLKVMRMNTAVFRDYRSYIEGDHRFKKVGRGRKMIFAWTKKEFSNLKRMYENEVKVPKPYAFHKNVVIMEYLEYEGLPAPMLKSAYIEDVESLYNTILDNLKTLITRAELVHGDLSEYNILITKDGPYMIDVSQGVPLTHPRADELFERDAENLARYFSKLGVDTSRKKIIEFVMEEGEKI